MAEKGGIFYEKIINYMDEYEGYDVVAYYDECYILIKGGETAKITEEELFLL